MFRNFLKGNNDRKFKNDLKAIGVVGAIAGIFAIRRRNKRKRNK